MQLSASAVEGQTSQCALLINQLVMASQMPYIIWSYLQYTILKNTGIYFLCPWNVLMLQVWVKVLSENSLICIRFLYEIIRRGCLFIVCAACEFWIIITSFLHLHALPRHWPEALMSYFIHCYARRLLSKQHILSVSVHRVSVSLSAQKRMFSAVMLRNHFPQCLHGTLSKLCSWQKCF